MEFINFRHKVDKRKPLTYMLRNPPEVNTMLNLNNPMCEAFPRVSFFLERFFRTVSWRSSNLFLFFFQRQKGLQTSLTFFLQKNDI